MKLIQLISYCILIASVLSAWKPAYAILGESGDTINTDYKTLHGVYQATIPHEKFTVEEITSKATTVREYVSSSGTVFGIAWNGYVHPDLSQLIGSYWSEYSAALQKALHIPGRPSQKIETDTVVVEKWGHMRDLQGRAYVPSLIPAGVSIADIK